MIGRLNHVAIAVPDLEAAAAQYRTALGATVGAPQDEPDHGVGADVSDAPLVLGLNFLELLFSDARDHGPQALDELLRDAHLLNEPGHAGVQVAAPS